STSPFDPWVAGGAVALMVLAFLFAFFWNRTRLVSFGLLFLFLNLVPVLNAPWMAANVFTERYLYLPSVGFCWVLGWAGMTLWRATARHGVMWRGIMVASVLAIAALCTLRIMRRNRDWHETRRSTRPHLPRNLTPTYFTSTSLRSISTETISRMPSRNYARRIR